MIYQVVYVSSAADNLAKAHLEEILEVSRRNNPKRQVTGLLLFKGGVFVQFLEGDYQVVQDLIAKIAEDQRHTNVKIIWENTSNDRTFGNWAMAYKDLGELDLSWANHLMSLANQKESTVQVLQKLKSTL